jgi:hypothetical protein
MSIFQESALPIMHCQHVKGYSFVLENFSFLPHMLQEQDIDHWFLIFRSILIFAAAAIPSRQAQQTIYQIHAHLYSSLIEISFAK